MKVQLKLTTWNVPQPLQAQAQKVILLYGVVKVKEMTLQDFLIELDRADNVREYKTSEPQEN